MFIYIFLHGVSIFFYLKNYKDIDCNYYLKKTPVL